MGKKITMIHHLLAKQFFYVCVVSVLWTGWSWYSDNLVWPQEYYNLDQLTPVESPPIKPLECGIERETPNSTYMGGDPMANGLTNYNYDTNGDGMKDVVLMHPTGDENPYPLFYFFDRDYDNEPDIAYVDKVRDGHCYFGKNGNIQVYWVKPKIKPGGDLQCDGPGHEGQCRQISPKESEL